SPVMAGLSSLDAGARADAKLPERLRGGSWARTGAYPRWRASGAGQDRNPCRGRNRCAVSPGLAATSPDTALPGGVAHPGNYSPHRQQATVPAPSGSETLVGARARFGAPAVVRKGLLDDCAPDPAPAGSLTLGWALV